jgi:hypothetical protein
MKKTAKLFLYLAAFALTLNACSDDDDDSVSPTPANNSSTDTTSIASFTSISTDPMGDESQVQTGATTFVDGLDALETLFLYDSINDVLKFRIKVADMSKAASSPSVDLSFLLPNGTDGNNDSTKTPFRGTTATHKTASLYADANGSAPSTYTYTSTYAANGVAYTTQIYRNNFSSICGGCVSINVDVSNNWMTISLDRKKVISDSELGASKTATITLVANVGVERGNSDLAVDGSQFTITLP